MLIKNLLRIGFVVAENSCSDAIRSIEVHRFIPEVLILAQEAICSDVTGYSATFELPLSISSTVAAFQTCEKMVAFTLERHGLVSFMNKVLLKLCALPVIFGRIVRWVRLAHKFPHSVRIMRAIVTRHTGNRFTLGTLDIEISLGIIIPIFSGTR